MEIEPTKIVHGQGLRKLEYQSINSTNDKAKWDKEEQYEYGQISFTLAIAYSWYVDIKILLILGYSHLNLGPSKRKYLELKYIYH